MKLSILYFAKLAEDLQCTEESLELAEGSKLYSLIENLVARGGAWQGLNEHSINCAVNQSIVKENCVLQQGDEIAFFPPVTGG